jgi:hypothetical protein
VSGGPDPRRFAIRAALLVLPLVLGSLALPRLLPWLRGSLHGAPGPAAGALAPSAEPTAEQRAEAARAEQEVEATEDRWRRAEVLAPRAGTRSGSGELTAPFEGFGVSVITFPPGAQVTVNGRDVGESPVVASVTCEPGTVVAVLASKPPHPPRRATTTCRADTLVELTLRLGRGSDAR